MSEFPEASEPSFSDMADAFDSVLTARPRARGSGRRQGMSAANLVREGGPNSYATTIPGGYVSTLLRQSSAMIESPPWYFETMAFLGDTPGIAWHSAAYGAREADRQHAIAVRWFTSRGGGQEVEHHGPRAAEELEAA